MATRRSRIVRKHKPRAPVESGEGEGRTPFAVADGVFSAHEPELFRPDCEALCCRLANAAARQPDVRAVHISLGSGTCRIEFDPERANAAQMAECFTRAVRAAVAEEPADARRGFERGWTALSVFPHGKTVSTWETIREGEGEVRLRNRIVNKDSGLARRVAHELAHAPGVNSCRTAFWTRELDVRFDPATTSPGRLVAAAEEAFQQTLRPALDRSTVEEPAPPAMATGLRRLWYVGLAGGSFALTLVGLVVPGVPTVPFLLATSYYLVRSSPRLNALLLKSRFFGPILDDLQHWGGLRRINKIKLGALTLVVSAVTIVVAGPPLVLLVVMFAVASASLYAISRLPGVPSRARRSSALAPAAA